MKYTPMIESESFRPISNELDYSGQYTDVTLVRATSHARLYRMYRAGRLFMAKAPASDDARSLELLKREYELTLGLSQASGRHGRARVQRRCCGRCSPPDFRQSMP